MTLEEILDQDKHLWPHCLDSEFQGTDKRRYHSYVPHYDNLLKEYQNKQINFLEIGIDRGGSISLFKEYFPLASLYFLDVRPEALLPQHQHVDNRIHILFKNAYSLETARSLPNFDIIIDDGPHYPITWPLQGLELYWNKLNRGGLFVIEDVQHFEWIEQFKKAVPRSEVKEFLIYDHRHERIKISPHDDVLFVIKKMD